MSDAVTRGVGVRATRALPLLLLLLGAPAVAQAPAPAGTQATAKDLYAEGVGLFKQGDFPGAAEKFQAAYNLDPSPILLYNLARASEEMGDAEAATLHYRAYLARYPAAEDRAAVERSIRILTKVVEARKEGTLIIEALPEDASVTFNHAPAPEPNPDGGWTLLAGRYVVGVGTPDGARWDEEVDVPGGETLHVTYEGGAGLALAGEAGGEDDGRRPLRLWGYVTAGAGAALLGGGIYFGVRAADAADEHNRIRREIAQARSEPSSATLTAKDQAATDANNNALAANILYGVGGAALVAGTTLVLLDLLGAREGGAPEGGAAEGGTALVPFSGGLALLGTF